MDKAKASMEDVFSAKPLVEGWNSLLEKLWLLTTYWVKLAIWNNNVKIIMNFFSLIATNKL